jgi:hypothetical protein
MEEVGDGVIGHVDGGVREGLNQPSLVPWQTGTEAIGTAAGVLVEPIQRADKGFPRQLVKDIHALQARVRLCPPIRLPVHQVPGMPAPQTLR